MSTSTRGRGVRPMWSHVDRGRGSKAWFFVDVINGWPLIKNEWILSSALTLTELRLQAFLCCGRWFYGTRCIYWSEELKCWQWNRETTDCGAKDNVGMQADTKVMCCCWGGHINYDVRMQADTKPAILNQWSAYHWWSTTICLVVLKQELFYF